MAETALKEIAQTIKPKRKPYKRKFDKQKVQALADKGIIATDIAKMQGVALSTITRYLESIGRKAKEIQQYKRDKAESLALSQLKMQTITDMIADEWLSDPEKIKAQDIRTQKEVLIAANSVKTYDFNSERLERGESTQNVLSIHGDIAEMKRLRMAKDGKTQGD